MRHALHICRYTVISPGTVEKMNSQITYYHSALVEICGNFIDSLITNSVNNRTKRLDARRSKGLHKFHCNTLSSCILDTHAKRYQIISVDVEETTQTRELHCTSLASVQFCHSEKKDLGANYIRNLCQLSYIETGSLT